VKPSLPPLPRQITAWFWISAILCFVVSLTVWFGGDDSSRFKVENLLYGILLPIVGLLSIRRGKTATIFLLLIGILFLWGQAEALFATSKPSHEVPWYLIVLTFVPAVSFLFTGIQGLRFWKHLKLI